MSEKSDSSHPLTEFLRGKKDLRDFAQKQSGVFGKENAYLTKLFPLALQSPGLFEALVSSAQAYRLAGLQSTVPQIEVLFHRGNAIRSLRDAITCSDSPASDTIIWTVILLLGTDYVYEDMVSFGAHMKAIIEMVKYRGGIDKLGDDGALRTLIKHATSMHLLMIEHHGVPQDRIPNTSSLMDQRLTSSELQSAILHLPAGFQTLAVSGSLQEPILQRLCNVENNMDNIRVRPSESAALRSFFAKQPGTLDECLYSAVVLYFFQVYHSTRFSKTYIRTLHNVASAVRRFTPTTPTERDCLAWVLTVAGAGTRHSGWASDNNNNNKSFDFMQHMLQTLPETRARARWRMMLERFFYTDATDVEWDLAWGEAGGGGGEEEEEEYGVADGWG